MESLVVHVHTDNLGTKEFNRKLSFRRARAIVTFLKAQGQFSDDVQLSGLGHGFSQPVGDNGTEEGRLENRRIEIVIKGQGCR